MITVLMVARNDRAIDDAVIDALYRQGVPFAFYVCPKPYSSNLRTKWRNICSGRNFLRRHIEPGYVFWLDSDVVLPEGALKALKGRLDRDYNLGAVGCFYGDSDTTGEHVGMGALMVRSWIADRINFRAGRGRCECLNFCRDVRKMGFRAEYDRSLVAQHLARV